MIYEVSPFFEENLVASIKIEESATWVNQLVIVEANRTFKGNEKRFSFAHAGHPKVSYRKMSADREFTTRSWRVQKRLPFVGRHSFPSINEGRQRDYPLRDLDIHDDDIVITSDIDEVLDARLADRIVEETLRRQIVTFGLYMNVYFLNAFDFNTVGPPDFSYRVFAMTGRFLRKMDHGFDKLRKLGESGSLMNSVYRIPGYSGFHLSWIGDDRAVARKMLAYAHRPSDFNGEIYQGDGTVHREAIMRSMRRLHHPMDPNLTLEVRDDITLLTAVERHRQDSLAPYFVNRT